MIGDRGMGIRVGGMKLSGAQSRAVELLAGEEGWVRRGAIAKSTMDVLERLDMVERRWDDAIQRATYRATQNARDWVRGQQEDATTETHGECGKPLTDHCATCEECPRVDGTGCWCVTVGTDDQPEVIHGACGKPETLHCGQCPTCPVEGEACGCPVGNMTGTVPAAWLMAVTDSDGTEVTGYAGEAYLRVALRREGVPREHVSAGHPGAYRDGDRVIAWHVPGTEVPTVDVPGDPMGWLGGTPTPTADDVAAMVGDPVAWLDGLTTIQAPTPVPGFVIDSRPTVRDMWNELCQDAMDGGDSDRWALLEKGARVADTAYERYSRDWLSVAMAVVADGTAITADEVSGLGTVEETVSSIRAATGTGVRWSAKGRKRKVNNGAGCRRNGRK